MPAKSQTILTRLHATDWDLARLSFADGQIMIQRDLVTIKLEPPYVHLTMHGVPSPVENLRGLCTVVHIFEINAVKVASFYTLNRIETK